MPRYKRQFDASTGNDIERVQKQALRIIVPPEYEYNRALQECELKTLQERRDDLCVRLIKQMSEPSHNLHSGNALR